MKKKLSLLLAALLVVGAVFTGCGSKKEEAGADGLTEVTMAFCTFTGYSPMFIAQEQGYFEDAGIQMELLGHDFFAFVNIETERTNVLYRRKDGNLGLLEPEA